MVNSIIDFQVALLTFTKLHHVEINRDQVNQATDLWNHLPEEDRAVPEIVQYIAFQIFIKQDQPTSLQNIHQKVVNRTLISNSFISRFKEMALKSQLDQWQSSGYVEKARERIFFAFINNSTALDLTGLKLTTLPTAIKLLINLTHLLLSNNNLSSLPAEIFGLNRLTNLYVSNNQLSKIPDDICRLTRLIFLDISKNKIASISPLLSKQLPKLTIKFDDSITVLPEHLIPK